MPRATEMYQPCRKPLPSPPSVAVSAVAGIPWPCLSDCWLSGSCFTLIGGFPSQPRLGRCQRLAHYAAAGSASGDSCGGYGSCFSTLA
jgi:hypothetical protein